jgi:hypothetical protein
MFALTPDLPDPGDLKPLSDAIDALCDVFQEDRETIIDGLAEVVRRQAELEHLKETFRQAGYR